MAPAGSNGTGCSPTEELQRMHSRYSSQGIGTLACSQGGDLTSPQGAPGFVQDPTGYLLTLPGRQVPALLLVWSVCASVRACMRL